MSLLSSVVFSALPIAGVTLLIYQFFQKDQTLNKWYHKIFLVPVLASVVLVLFGVIIGILYTGGLSSGVDIALWRIRDVFGPMLLISLFVVLIVVLFK